MSKDRKVYPLLAAAVLMVLALAETATAGGKPEKETITFSETFEDEFLSDACGLDVTTTVTGRLTFFTFPDQPVGPQDITSVHVDFVATAGDNMARFKDVGIDLVRVEPDGTAVLMIVGQLPFDFTGVLMIDLTTGEAILEPHHFVDTTRVCHLLTK
ncbi:MAG: hypothetical protein ACRDIZ_03125 [Actinomycetota bacterium]